MSAVIDEDGNTQTCSWTARPCGTPSAPASKQVFRDRIAAALAATTTARPKPGQPHHGLDRAVEAVPLPGRSLAPAHGTRQGEAIVRTEAEITADAAQERPFSNHSEYEVWAERHCYECAHDDEATETYCPILGVALLGGWPVEWTRRRHEWTANGESGTYEVVDTCTEFQQRPEWPGDDDLDAGPPPPPEPAPECDGQLDLVDAYLPTALAEITRAPADLQSTST